MDSKDWGIADGAKRHAALLTKAARLHRAAKLTEAEKAYRDYLANAPHDALAWSNLGALYRSKRDYEQALTCQKRAFSLDRDAPHIRTNYANILSDVGRYEHSLRLRHGLLADKPSDPAQMAMVGRCLRGEGRYAEAIAWLQQALAAHPHDHELRLQLAFGQFGAQDFASALDNYRARWKAGQLRPRDMQVPEWAGETVDGKTVLVLSEQGLGDTVLFARFLPWLKALGARVVLQVRPPLGRLCAALDGVDSVVTKAPPSAGIDFWVNLIDLARIGLRGPANIPVPATLDSPVAAREQARAIIAPYADKFRVGVAWSGSVTYKANAFRSFSHRAFLPLAAIPGVQLFSLYKGPLTRQFVADPDAAAIIDAASGDQDLADCAATMQQMDLVITVDTVTAHIAGSLGLRTWVALHWDPFWVYRHAGDTTPWYPSMRLYRQEEPEDWNVPLASIEADLKALSATRNRT